MIKKAIALAVIICTVYWSFSTLMPSEVTSIDSPETQFSTHRALLHLKEIAQAPHYLGSKEHDRVRDYIVKQLQDLGLETQIQTHFSIDDSGNLAKPKNIIGCLRGREKGKALLLLTHYDSDPHSSVGASDAGSGVVTILEGLRAFLKANKTPKNDIVVLISDAEELGLNGASTFVNQHEWAKDIGLAVNFEARGSGGPSLMFIETNQGNAKLIKGFIEANPDFPVSSSLFYSIYKILPNDTDLTVFREDGDIDGFNFAFIDDHFDYHTQLDNYDRLDRNTLEHQGRYLMPMLHYFSEANLEDLKSDQEQVYFNTPIFKMVSYPFSWIYPMLIIAMVVFIILLVYGFKQEVLRVKEIGKGFLAIFSALILAAVVGYFGWPMFKAIYPHYNEMLHGFTYNGYAYITAFTFLSLAICLGVYHKVYRNNNTASLLVAPLMVWIIICLGVALKLKGASFFIVPVYFALLSLFVIIRQKQPNSIAMALLSVPMLVILVPLVKLFPVGLGLKMMVANTALVVLIFGLLITVFGFFKHKKLWGYLCVLVTLYFFVSAHLQSGFSSERPKPNSLLYVYNADDNTAIWATYDKMLDNWTTPFFGEQPEDASTLNNNIIDSKYNSGFTFTKAAPVKALSEPIVQVFKDTIIGEYRQVRLAIIPQRPINRMELFADSLTTFQSFKANGQVLKNKGKFKSNRLLSYFVADNDSLALEFEVPKNQKTRFTLLEASYDLLQDGTFEIPKREAAMMPKPFVLNDAVVVQKTISVP
ncbi:M20/M25/M40 family metallo-hydrolase [Aestuariivivens insulae]|uniref:M20/M25/M40 family metallo-hydrolase n=1 Tax=Aestuariivivens insulae TaxID=1621988 RepID=UPI001F577116|nr:M20/M25/M40 family metallo-hydrolase [Aestuariivivens insulae]